MANPKMAMNLYRLSVGMSGVLNMMVGFIKYNEILRVYFIKIYLLLNVRRLYETGEVFIFIKTLQSSNF